MGYPSEKKHGQKPFGGIWTLVKYDTPNDGTTPKWYLNKKPYNNFMRITWHIHESKRVVCYYSHQNVVVTVIRGPFSIKQPATRSPLYSYPPKTTPFFKVEGLRDGDNLENETFSEQHKVIFVGEATWMKCWVNCLQFSREKNDITTKRPIS